MWRRKVGCSERSKGAIMNQYLWMVFATFCIAMNSIRVIVLDKRVKELEKRLEKLTPTPQEAN
jgi:hypothetical protein